MQHALMGAGVFRDSICSNRDDAASLPRSRLAAPGGSTVMSWTLGRLLVAGDAHAQQVTRLFCLFAQARLEGDGEMATDTAGRQAGNRQHDRIA